MTKKSFFIILGLSVITTYGVAIIDASIRNSFLAGEAGFPLKFSSSSLFGSENTDYLMLFIDVVFWFVIIFGIWKLILIVFKR